MVRSTRWVAVLILAEWASGCGHRNHPVTFTPAALSRAKSTGLSTPHHDDQVMATVVSPMGWKADPLKSTDQHKHRVWLSPSGDTAYGVIYFTVPLPVGAELALVGFMNSMRHSEGEATLVSKETDDTLPGIRFVAEGGQYRIRANLVMGGFEGWAIYAASLRDRPVNYRELRLAIQAREQTRLDQ